MKLAAAARSAGVTAAMTNAVRVGTSICDNALRANRSPSASGRVGANAARIRNTLAGMCVNTIVLRRPIFFATTGAASCENADSRPVTKKNWPASGSESPKRSKSQSASSEFTTRPPANASTLKSAASLNTTRRDVPSGFATDTVAPLPRGSRR